MNPAAPDPRVLFVIPGEPEGPSMIFAKRQYQAVARHLNAEVFYLASRTSVRILAAEARRFRRHIARQRPHVVHAQYGTVTAAFCALLCFCPLVITYRGSDLNPCPSMNWWRSAAGRLLSQLAALRASWIVCVSRELAGRLWWKRRRVDILPSGVDTERFRPRAREAALARLGWAAEDRVVLFNAGRSPAVKRLDLAEAAVEVARRQEPRIRLEVLDGYVDPERIPWLMNAARCLLVTSDKEGSPTVVQEAMASDLPVVSVAVGDLEERLAPVAGCRIEARDAARLGQALVEVCGAEQRSDGSRFVAALSVEAIAQRLVAIYREIGRTPSGVRRSAAERPA